jgi:diguanylate cyclase (GGDEF)-like protein
MTGVYSPALVALSFIIAMMASYVALDLAGRLTTAHGRAVWFWLTGGALAMGTGIWSMHFIGMLALHMPIPMAYDLPTTFASMVIAVIVSGFALFTVGRTTLTGSRLAYGGIVMGIGIVGMHYTGMMAMEVAPDITYDPATVAASAAIAIAASWAALWLAFTLRSNTVSGGVWKRLGSSVVMAAAIVGMHYTGMAAAHFASNTVCTVPVDQVNTLWLAGVIAGFATLFLAATMLISVLDGELARKLEAANLTILELAQTDVLTALANRRSFEERLKLAFAGIKRGGNQFSVLYFDLDHFKEVNDTLGHAAGDTLLRGVADRLRKVVRETDLLARFGGDEFAILNTNAPTPMASGTLAAAVAKAVAIPFTLNDTEVQVTASIGIAAYSPDLTEPDDMLKQADLALYRAKAEGRNCYRFHSSELDAKVHERVTIADDLRTALERRHLELHYQPVIDLATRRIVALEALTRWNHPTRGMLYPDVFIPVAETTGSIAALGRWVFDAACQQLRAWQDLGIAPPVVAVNLSAAQFRSAPHLELDIAASLEKWNIAADAMELEIAESDWTEMAERYDDALVRLRQMGIRLAIDDFGIGHASLDELARYPIHHLKVAQVLLSRVSTDPKHANLVRAAVRMGQELGVTVVAEGVETEDQARLVTTAGCDRAQGYYFGRPIPVRAVTELLMNHAATTHALAR